MDGLLQAKSMQFEGVGYLPEHLSGMSPGQTSSPAMTSLGGTPLAAR